MVRRTRPSDVRLHIIQRFRVRFFAPAPDLLRLQRLKKRKLQLRDRIAFIEDQITPDIIA